LHKIDIIEGVDENQQTLSADVTSGSSAAACKRVKNNCERGEDLRLEKSEIEKELSISAYIFFSTNPPHGRQHLKKFAGREVENMSRCQSRWVAPQRDSL